MKRHTDRSPFVIKEGTKRMDLVMRVTDKLLQEGLINTSGFSSMPEAAGYVAVVIEKSFFEEKAKEDDNKLQPEQDAKKKPGRIKALFVNMIDDIIYLVCDLFTMFVTGIVPLMLLFLFIVAFMLFICFCEIAAEKVLCYFNSIILFHTIL